MAEKVLYQCREVQLLQSGRAYVVEIAGEGPRGEFANPLEAWSCFIDILDGRVRRRIGDMLERQGLDRFTGKKIGGKKDV